MDVQRATFVESLYSSLKKQASKAIVEHNKMVAIAKAYMEDGLEEQECVELLMIDGISREASECYVSMVTSEKQDDNLNEYSFQFQDATGSILSSFDIGRTIRAANEDQAWTMAEEIVNSEVDVESQKLLSVNRIG
jgi:uncharacterized protein YrzB (UPF0473 family)